MKIDKHELDFRRDKIYILLISTYGLNNAIKIINGVRKKLIGEKKRRKLLEE
jgi:hypothetical protein